ncbi:glycosyltransferase [Amycolatopsis sp. PS_44_ISF1]|uniref:glycosyltransferase n=1 Tax=Amycolatopsis sp. PS_44_ISF1 TaxID=2974917 RepID=UPI0028DED15C|nr:glycosyltransferase [Amycolatopsis sp. PS_44_ISF1]MDT8913067.1 glycosyltransferase [Amycolatopsis sp. PS_44_ISF1]
MAGRVIYAGFEVQYPVGGNRLLTEHVALLAAAGVDAYRWSPTPGFRYDWFEDTVPALSGAELEMAAEDLLVVPELTILPGHDPAPGGRKVIFVQGHFMMFLTCPELNPYPGWSVPPTLWTISRDAVEVISRAVPDLPPPVLVPNPIDAQLFRPVEKKPSIAWMSRKRPSESALLKQILRNDPRSAGVELRDIRGLPHEEVARVLADTSVFVALGAPEGEGFGLPVAEALASGCLVTGYGLGGGDELFEAPSAWPVPSLRTVELADRALELVHRTGTGRVRAEGRQWLVDRYHGKATTEALLTGIEAARRGPARATTAVHPTAWEAELMRVIAPYAAPLEAAGLDEQD